MITIRKIRPDEHYFLREMLEQAIYFPDESRKQEKLLELEPILSKYFENFGRIGDLALVAENQAGLVGAIWTRLFAKEKGSYGFVDEKTPELSMAIKEDHRGQGIGTLLMKSLCEELKQKGFGQVSLSVDKRNPALNLYERSGFELFSEDKNACTMLRVIE